MRRSLRYPLVLILLTVVYLLIFPVSTGRELVIRRSWVLSALDVPIAAGAANNLLIPVRLRNYFGYISYSGELIFRAPVAYGVALSRRGFVSFGKSPDQLVLQNPDGSYMATIPQSGYPQFAGDSLFVKSGRDTVVSAYSLDGILRWTKQLEGSLSSIQAEDGLTALGLLSGGVIAIDENGSQIDIEGVESNYELIVYGSAIHQSSGTLATVIGPTEPALVLYNIRDNQFVPSLRVDLHGRPRSLTPVAITVDGQHAVFYDQGVRIVHIESGNEYFVAARYRLLQIETMSDQGLVATLGLGTDRDPQRGFRLPAELIFFDHGGVVPVRAAFAADWAFLLAADGSTILGIDDRILKFRVELE